MLKKVDRDLPDVWERRNSTGPLVTVPLGAIDCCLGYQYCCIQYLVPDTWYDTWYFEVSFFILEMEKKELSAVAWLMKSVSNNN